MCVWHDSFIRVPSLNFFLCVGHDSTYVCHDSFVESAVVQGLLWGGSISRLLEIIGLFCKRALQKRRYSAKEPYNFKEPTNRSHPIVSTYVYVWLVNKSGHMHAHLTVLDPQTRLIKTYHTYENVWDSIYKDTDSTYKDFISLCLSMSHSASEALL